VAANPIQVQPTENKLLIISYHGWDLNFPTSDDWKIHRVNIENFENAPGDVLSTELLDQGPLWGFARRLDGCQVRPDGKVWFLGYDYADEKNRLWLTSPDLETVLEDYVINGTGTGAGGTTTTTISAFAFSVDEDGRAWVTSELFPDQILRVNVDDDITAIDLQPMTGETFQTTTFFVCDWDGNAYYFGSDTGPNEILKAPLSDLEDVTSAGFSQPEVADARGIIYQSEVISDTYRILGSRNFNAIGSDSLYTVIQTGRFAINRSTGRVWYWQGGDRLSTFVPDWDTSVPSDGSTFRGVVTAQNPAHWLQCDQVDSEDAFEDQGFIGVDGDPVGMDSGSYQALGGMSVSANANPSDTRVWYGPSSGMGTVTMAELSSGPLVDYSTISVSLVMALPNSGVVGPGTERTTVSAPWFTLGADNETLILTVINDGGPVSDHRVTLLNDAIQNFDNPSTGPVEESTFAFSYDSLYAYVSWTYNNDTKQSRLFINGELRGVETLDFEEAGSLSEDLVLYSWLQSLASNFVYFSQFQVYDRVLTAQEIQNQYKAYTGQ
jgi:hypothetical protein